MSLFCLIVGLCCIIAGTIGCGNLQEKPVKVQVDPVNVSHKISIDTDRLEDLYEARCKKELDPIDYPSPEVYDQAVKDCTNEYVTDFLLIVEAVK